MFFFFNDTATTEIYTLSLHDALPIYGAEILRRVERHGVTLMCGAPAVWNAVLDAAVQWDGPVPGREDRKSTRLNSSHANISYAVFCLKKKKQHFQNTFFPNSFLSHFS